MPQAEIGEANPITAIRQHPLVVVFFTLIFGLLGAWFAVDQPESFSSMTGLVVEDARSSTLFNSRSSDAERYVADQVAILQSRVVFERASQLLAAQDPPISISAGSFSNNTTITSDPDSNYITISFIAGSAQRARAGAGAIGLAYEAVIEEALAEDAEQAVAELDKAIDAAVQEIEGLQSQIEALRTNVDERTELDAQLAEIVASLVELRRETVTLEEEGIDVPIQPVGTEGAPTEDELLRAAASDIAARIEQLTEELRSRLLVSEAEAQIPAAAFLLRQQEDAATRLSELTLQRSQIEVDARLVGNGVAFLSPAGPAVARGVPTTTAVVLLTATGLLLGVGIAYWLSQRRHGYVEDRLSPGVVLEAPLLAELPRLSKGGGLSGARESDDGRTPPTEDAILLPILNSPTTVQAEAYRILVGALIKRLEAKQTESGSQRGITIAVCASTFAEGPTVVAVNAAIAASYAGLNVVLVDGDFGTQDASRLLAGARGRSGSLGLTDIVQTGARLQNAVVEIETGAEGSLALLGRGQGDLSASDLFGSRKTSSLLSELEEQYDLVIIDLPPLLQVGYASVALQQVEEAVVVVRHYGPMDNLHELRHRLGVVNTEAVGYVYTNAPPRGTA